MSVDSRSALRAVYLDYIRCLNTRDWEDLDRFIDDDIHYNGERLGLEGYRKQRQQEVGNIPDLRFTTSILVSEPPLIAARLDFDCAPRGSFLGLPVNGRRVRFAENVIYGFKAGKIANVWSIVDRAAIESQLP